jgi:hypothetical protein
MSGTILAAATLFAVAGSPLSAQVNMTGTWALEVDVAGAVSTPSMVLQQSGMTLTGRYTSEQLGQADVTGTVEGSNVTVSFGGELQGQAFTVTYAGTVGADGVWSGTFDLGGLADGTFRGTKANQ